MLRIITPEPAAGYVDRETWRDEAYGDEFEIVLGKRQIASLLFVGIVVVAISSGVSYVAGKSVAMKNTAQAPQVLPPPPPPAKYAEIELFELPAAAAAALSTPSVNGAEQALDESLFGGITAAGRYIQVASVDRAAAAVLAQGLRQRSFKTIVAPGAQQDVYRVLVGPFENSGEAQGAREAIAGIGVAQSTHRVAVP
jgi:hypothetical protein